MIRPQIAPVCNHSREHALFTVKNHSEKEKKKKIKKKKKKENTRRYTHTMRLGQYFALLDTTTTFFKKKK
jgi:hypothetical protein